MAAAVSGGIATPTLATPLTAPAPATPVTPAQFVVSMGPSDLAAKLKDTPVGQIHVPTLGGGILDVASKLKVGHSH